MDYIWNILYGNIIYSMSVGIIWNILNGNIYSLYLWFIYGMHQMEISYTQGMYTLFMEYII